QTLKSIDITRLVAWTVLLVAVIEWFPFFLQIMLNFFNMNLREFPVEDILLVIAPILCPFVTLFLSLAGWKHPAGVKKVMAMAAVPAMLACAVLNWLAFSSYYQYYGIFAPDLSTIGATGGAFGILAYLTPLAKPMLYWTNGFTFYVLVPVLFTAGTAGTARLQYSHELNLGALIAALYMTFRPGSIVDTTFRFTIVLLAACAAWLLHLVNKAYKEDRADQAASYIIDASAIPKWAEEGLAILLAISLINPAMSAMGMLNTTWTWACIAAATGLVEVMILKNLRITSKAPGIAVFAGLVSVETLVIWADIDSTLLAVEPWLHGAALFLLGLLFPACFPLFSRKRANLYLINPGRQFLFNLIGVASFLLPVIIIATFPPLTTLAGVLIVGIGGGLSLLAILVADQKKNRT
ncbi:MAG: hypothetical protein GYA24_05470, partial [Candidatus Lokiarchaeota archaeon]|nr:hypothetical protein [Candidatus Lokiarchaeota archaeon]